MKTTQLALRCMRFSEIKDIGKLPMDDAITMIDAWNSAFQEYYNLAPSIYSKTTISSQFPDQTSISLNINIGDNVLDQDYFTSEQRGASIQIGDDQQWNEITGLNSILDSYKGTAGSQSAIIYGDSIVLSADQFKRISGRPRISNGIQLEHDERIRERKWLGQRGFGCPRRYCVEPIGEAQGGKDLLVLRVDPIPDQLYTVRMEVILAPFRATYEDLVTPRDIPVPDHRIERLLVPIMISYLEGTPFWPKDKLVSKGIFLRADAARKGVSEIDDVIALPQNRVGTPRGW